MSSKFDHSLLEDEEGSIKSEKYGFIVSSDNNQKNNKILLFSEAYPDDEVSVDDILNFYLGE